MRRDYIRRAARNWQGKELGNRCGSDDFSLPTY